MPATSRAQQLSAARDDLQRGRFREAERRLLSMLDAHGEDREVLETLAALYLRTARLEQAEHAFRRLAAGWADRAQYALELGALLERRGERDQAAQSYAAAIEREPTLAVARFNHACFLRRGGQLEEALREHQQALDLGIAQPEEVLSNMAAIHTQLRRDDAARTLLERALAANPRYLPALYNFGLLREETGDRDGAIALFERILEQDPSYFDALIRIAHARRIARADDPVVKKLRRALRRSQLEPLAREGLHIALGKALDDAGAYDEAFGQFQQGNRWAAARVPAYDREATERRTAQILETFSPEWLARAKPVSERRLVFITGMFRSGSTLFEQVLASHPGIVAGGEIDYFGPRLARLGLAFPEGLARPGADTWRALGTGYLDYLDRTFPTGRIVTDKRPDAFALLPLMRALFPNARFVHTVRDPMDTCLSIFFEQLESGLSYATDLENAAHYYNQYRRLMARWKALFGDAIYDAVYDEFVIDPEATTRALLRFLDLDWHPGCLDFQHVANRVRTASVSQVREPLYRRSSGRWRNYERHLGALRQALGGWRN
jgi:tetratricopeptide (TPR) repeat protein